jgi:hypothetical protein
VIASDLAVFREIAGDVPDYVDPLDGATWRRLIIDYSAPVSARRAAQLARLSDWSPPKWTAHFAEVDAFLEASCISPSKVLAEKDAPCCRPAATFDEGLVP